MKLLSALTTTCLLTKLKQSSPSFFERIVVELLVKMGYGGSRADAGKAIGKSATGYIADRLYTMAFTIRGDSVRIISLRKANDREIKTYEKTTDR